MKIRNALISVTDKSGLDELAAALRGFGAKLYSSGGTARYLRDAGFEVTEISELTQSPEILDGRVKTLHPSVHAGILADMQNEAHRRELASRNLPSFDLVVVNFYAFAGGGDEAKMIESIDIGGPAMVRAAAKNYRSTAVLTDVRDYPVFIGELEKNNGAVDEKNRRELAKKAFVKIAQLDIAIAEAMSAEEDGAFARDRFVYLRKMSDLNYGENPHQRAACYSARGGNHSLHQLQGKPPGFNNLLDAYCASRAVAQFSQQAVAIIKHNNPCGVAVAATQSEAFGKAYRADSVSAYGGVIAFNRALEGETARALTDYFWEVIIAPQFDSEAKRLLALRDRARALSSHVFEESSLQLTDIGGVMLLQQTDRSIGEGALVSRRAPSADEVSDLNFAWRVAAGVKSNAIVIAKNGATVGIGAGQMSRLDAAWIACEKARRAGVATSGAVAASDGFFPFADGLETLAKAGVRAVIYPRGSKNDSVVLDAANKLDMAVLLTDRRHFWH